MSLTVSQNIQNKNEQNLIRIISEFRIKFSFSFKFILILCIGLYSTLTFAQKGYEIKVKIKGIKDTTVILGHHFAKSMYPDDTIRVDKNGSGVFKGKKELPQGMYIIFLPTKNYFDFIVGDDQYFSIESDTTDFAKTVKIEGSKENQIFYDYQNLLIAKRDDVKKLQDQRKNAKTDEEKKKINEQFKLIDQEVKLYKEKVMKEQQNSFVGKFIKATQDIDVPDPPKDAAGNITDSLFQYRYYKDHYFDNFDISDKRMLYTPLYEEKVLTYIDKVIPQIPDTINGIVDMLVTKSRTSPELFRYMLGTLFNHYGQSQIMGFDAVALYIADKYYIKEATWSDTASIRKLKEQVARKMPLTLGKVAADVQLVFVPSEHFIAATDSIPLKKNPYVGNFFKLSDIKSDFIILFFWEADCSHCKIATPQMYSFYSKLKKKNVEVIAISTLFGEEGKLKWVNFVNEHKLYNWINAWNPYDYKFKEQYDIVSTPTIYILDKYRKIIAKRIGPEQCEEIIDHYIEVEQKIKNNSKPANQAK
jgi:thiol-disulfide isomerase/thioredoxin